jgi:hypothetical protein
MINAQVYAAGKHTKGGTVALHLPNHALCKFSFFQWMMGSHSKATEEVHMAAKIALQDITWGGFQKGFEQVYTNW